MKNVCISLCAALVLLCSCDGPLVDSTAATVDGVDVSLDDVVSLANSPEAASQNVGGAGVASLVENGKLGGNSTRWALSVYVQNALFDAAIKRYDINVDETRAAQLEEQYQGVSESVRPLAIDTVVKSEAVQASSPSREVVEQYRRLLIETFICFEGVFAPGSLADELSARIGAGESLESFVGEADENGSEVVAAAGEQTEACVQFQPTEIAELDEFLLNAEEGENGDFEAQGSIDGQSGVLFVKMGSRGVGFDEELMNQQAAQAFQNPQSSVSAWVASLIRIIDVDVDPRIGVLNSDPTSLIAPPESPLVVAAVDPLANETS